VVLITQKKNKGSEMDKKAGNPPYSTENVTPPQL
jgi:hypothetical protein